jgi:hypothetical protein
MAKTKQQSAAQRREQERQNRQQRTRVAQKSGKNRKDNSNNQTLWFIGGIVAMVVVIIGGFIVFANISTQKSQEGGPQAYKTVTTLPDDTFSRIGTGNVKSSPVTYVKNTPILKGPDGKPELLYIGGEFCPICAAQRYTLLAALSRFGTFSNVSTLTSSEDQVPTFTFHGASYKSDYIDFVSKEASDNNQQPYDTLTTQENNIVNTYNKAPYLPNSSPSSIPFMSIANQYVSVGSYYDHTLLIGKSYTDITNQLGDTNSDIARGVVGGANYLTAALCIVTNNQPANVCTSGSIPTIEQTIQKASFQNPSGDRLAQSISTMDADAPRRS